MVPVRMKTQHHRISSKNHRKILTENLSQRRLKRLHRILTRHNYTITVLKRNQVASRKFKTLKSTLKNCKTRLYNKKRGNNFRLVLKFMKVWKSLILREVSSMNLLARISHTSKPNHFR